MAMFRQTLQPIWRLVFRTGLTLVVEVQDDGTLKQVELLEPAYYRVVREPLVPLASGERSFYKPRVVEDGIKLCANTIDGVACIIRHEYDYGEFPQTLRAVWASRVEGSDRLFVVEGQDWEWLQREDEA